MILGLETLTRRRFEPGTRDALGEWVPGASTDTLFGGSWQPVGRKDREVLPEGVRSSVERMIYCEAGTLRAVDLRTGDAADHVIRDGVVYEVVHVETWPALLAHDLAFVVRLQEADDPAYLPEAA